MNTIYWLIANGHFTAQLGDFKTSTSIYQYISIVAHKIDYGDHLGSRHGGSGESRITLTTASAPGLHHSAAPCAQSLHVLLVCCTPVPSGIRSDSAPLCSLSVCNLYIKRAKVGHEVGCNWQLTAI